jgi:hypothetical protein
LTSTRQKESNREIIWASNRIKLIKIQNLRVWISYFRISNLIEREIFLKKKVCQENASFLHTLINVMRHLSEQTLLRSEDDQYFHERKLRSVQSIYDQKTHIEWSKLISMITNHSSDRAFVSSTKIITSFVHYRHKTYVVNWICKTEHVLKAFNRRFECVSQLHFRENEWVELLQFTYKERRKWLSRRKRKESTCIFQAKTTHILSFL